MRRAARPVRRDRPGTIVAGAGIICAMTDDRIRQPEQGLWACPFIAFEGDQDHRSDRPDYRHRCYAVGQPEPRALPHQERYCLAQAFTECPMFLDWARQEAAAALPGALAATAADTTEPETPATATPATATPAFLTARSRPALAGALTLAPRAPGAELPGGVWQPDVERREPARGQSSTASNRAVTLDTTPLAAAESGESMWDKPKPVENFPRLRPMGQQRGTLPLLPTVLVLAVVMVALLVYPILTSNKGSGTGAGKTPVATSSLATEEATDTPQASPSFRTHVVQKGEYLQSIANRYGVTWQDIAALNGISDPAKIYPGQKLKIPWPSEPTPSPTLDENATTRPPSPSPSAP